MITTNIVSKVAHIMRQNGLVKDPKEVKVDKAPIETKDAVELSPKAEEFANASKTGTDYEQEQRMKVERLKSLVQNGQYHMDESTIDDIASRIAKQFL